MKSKPEASKLRNFRGKIWVDGKGYTPDDIRALVKADTEIELLRKFVETLARSYCAVEISDKDCENNSYTNCGEHIGEEAKKLLAKLDKGEK